jgi:hypothetical protein
MTDTWLAFLPQTPATPSSLRVLVWRRLQQAGALNLGAGTWMLPHTEEHEQTLQTLLTELEKQGGSGFLFKTAPTTEEMQVQLVERFQAERAQDYQEFDGRCQEFLAEIEKETAAQKFTFAELEENEQDLLKLTRWLRKIQHRDFFPNATSREAQEAIARCRQILQAFTATVYQREGLSLSNEPDEGGGEQDLRKDHP